MWGVILKNFKRITQILKLICESVAKGQDDEIKDGP